MNQRVDLDREQWAAIRSLFDALAEASPAERERVLAESRQPAAVIAETKALLAAADGVGDFMQADAACSRARRSRRCNTSRSRPGRGSAPSRSSL